ncbi:MAG TPA: cytochrome c-type biogenesis protein [Rhizomicrobium sp.]|nr:cytochrome c-type biogenesis protein [Rhizomicrobium sp.]
MKPGGFKTVIALLLMMGSSHAAYAAAPVPETFSDPAKEARARHLQRQFFCLICAGESVDESNSSFATDVRRLVREQIAEGRTDKQIRDFFVARYGAAILTKPPVEPATWLLWLGPFGVLAIAGGVAWVTIKRAGKAET